MILSHIGADWLIVAVIAGLAVFFLVYGYFVGRDRDL